MVALGSSCSGDSSLVTYAGGRSKARLTGQYCKNNTLIAAVTFPPCRFCVLELERAIFEHQTCRPKTLTGLSALGG